VAILLVTIVQTMLGMKMENVNVCQDIDRIEKIKFAVKKIEKQTNK